MTSSRDDETLRRYREASAELDEQPSASARAAILAAAARQVQARPQSAAASRPAPRRRWPLAAAATVLLSTLTVMLATRTEQEMPTFAPPADRVAEQDAAIAPAKRPQLEAPAASVPDARMPAAPAVEAPKQTVPSEETAGPSSSRLSAPTREVPAGMANEAQPAGPQADTPSAEQKVKSALGKQSGNKLNGTAQPVERSEQQRAATEATPRAKEEVAREGEAASAAGARQAFPAAPADRLGSTAGASAPPASAPAPASSTVPAPVSPTTPSVAAPPPAVSGETAASRNAAKPDAQFQERARRDAGAPSTQTPSTQTPTAQSPSAQSGLRQQQVGRDFERTSESWLDYITRLRRDGRHDEADAELKRFRERFPAVTVPPAALPPFGPR